MGLIARKGLESEVARHENKMARDRFNLEVIAKFVKTADAMTQLRELVKVTKAAPSMPAEDQIYFIRQKLCSGGDPLLIFVQIIAIVEPSILVAFLLHWEETEAKAA